ncbi:MAG: hypothetical protein SCM11_11855 [Bacillota bacterium]|nr:hypothetical protein [Bacillota bacterium]
MYLKVAKKRFGVTIILCLVLMFALSGPVMAVDQTQDSLTEDLGINPSPRFSYTNVISTSMYTSASGITATGYILGYPGITDEVWIFLYLERYENGRWVTVGSWSEFAYTYFAYLEGFKSVASGYYYRVRGSYYAWSGNSYEQITGYSSSKYY